MAKKTKSKSRLDKFYKIAKEQGYRSRAAFKLIQLNKKYNFLQNATVLVDLCAAPGGWLQIASKYMGESAIIIGIDLDPIKPIKNVRTFQEDITTPKCVSMIKKEIQHMKVDVFLNDGAPNVGSNWSKDAYSQSELVLYALRLATKFLKKGGVFVTKVFRSNDYHSLIWVFNKLFGKVEASKPEASRINSAEIFVVCQQYLAPDVIDPKFFEPNFVFKDSEADVLDAMKNREVNSLKKVFETKKRNLIPENAPLTMYKKISLVDFMEIPNPYTAFVEYNAIDVSNKEAVEKFAAIYPVPADFEENCKDIKLLNKKQVGSLVKWKIKINQKQKKTIKDEEEAEKVVDEHAMVEEKPDQSYNYLKKADKIEKKNKEKQIIKFVKSKLINNDAALTNTMTDNLDGFDFLKHRDIISKGQIANVDEEEDIVVDPDEARRVDKNRKLNSYKEVSDNIEYLYEKKHRNNPKEKKRDIVDGIINNVQLKAKPELELPKKSNGKGVQEFKKTATEQVDIGLLQQHSKFFDRDIFNVLKDQKITQAKVAEPEKDESEEEVDSDREEMAQDDMHDDMEGYLEENFKDELREMDDDELAEILVVSKKMLRKKKRREIVDDAYNRYNYPENPSDLPKWFYEDERKHIGKIPMVTKEEVEAEKQKLKILKKRLPKKVMEAKARQKKRFFNNISKANVKAEQIFESDNLTGYSKANQINSLYRKAAKNARPKKKEVIVARKYNSAAPRKKKGRKFMVVDKRMRKDLRAEKNKKIKKRK